MPVTTTGAAFFTVGSAVGAFFGVVGAMLGVVTVCGVGLPACSGATAAGDSGPSGDRGSCSTEGGVGDAVFPPPKEAGEAVAGTASAPGFATGSSSSSSVDSEESAETLLACTREQLAVNRKQTHSSALAIRPEPLNEKLCFMGFSQKTPGSYCDVIPRLYSIIPGGGAVLPTAM